MLMTIMTSILFLANSYSWEIVVLLAGAAFASGFLIKAGVVFKQRKRILRLEDEMLSNHARILALEKRVAEQKKEKNSLPEFEIITSHSEAKAS